MRFAEQKWLYSQDDVIKWKHFPRYWPFVRGIQRSPGNSPLKDPWRTTLMFTLICARINGWVNNREAVDLRRHRAHCDVIVMDSIFAEVRLTANNSASLQAMTSHQTRDKPLPEAMMAMLLPSGELLINSRDISCAHIRYHINRINRSQLWSWP